MQRILTAFVDHCGNKLVNGAVLGQIQGFGTCLQSLSQGLPQQIVIAMAEAAAPMPLPWVLLLSPKSLLQ